MPSYTFVSTANAFVLRGATPVFVDICSQTQNIDSRLIEDAITNKTKAIVVVHYAGFSCELSQVVDIAKKYSIPLIEDAAQSIKAKYKDQYLGTFGDIACFSFHETKNITCGEGGAIVINNPKYLDRTAIIREKGTNRLQYINGRVDKYSWIDLGSSYLLSDLNASLLYSQLSRVNDITSQRLLIWERYYRSFSPYEKIYPIKLPGYPEYSAPNGHIFYLVLDSKRSRDAFIQLASSYKFMTVFHYVPLHLSKMGRDKCRVNGSLHNTELAGSGIIRLPLWLGVEAYQDKIIENCINILNTIYSKNC